MPEHCAQPSTDFASVATLLNALGGMAQKDQWAVWRLRYDDNGQLIKEPFENAALGIFKTWKDPKCQLSFRQAHDALVQLETIQESRYKVGQPYTGYALAFVLTDEDPYFCVDLDRKHLADDARLADLASWKLRFPGAMVETSISGKGYHLWGSFTGQVEQELCKFKLDDTVEVYRADRLMILGNQWGTVSGCADTELSHALNDLLRAAEASRANTYTIDPTQLFPPPEPDFTRTLDDNQLIEAIRHSVVKRINGELITVGDLWDCVPDRVALIQSSKAPGLVDWSNVEYALLSKLLRATGGDSKRVHDMMLGNAKWCEARKEKWDSFRQRMPFLPWSIARARTNVMRDVQTERAAGKPGAWLESVAHPFANTGLSGQQAGYNAFSQPTQGVGTGSVSNVVPLPVQQRSAASMEQAFAAITLACQTNSATVTQLVIPGASGDVDPVAMEERRNELLAQMRAGASDEETMYTMMDDFLRYAYRPDDQDIFTEIVRRSLGVLGFESKTKEVAKKVVCKRARALITNSPLEVMLTKSIKSEWVYHVGSSSYRRTGNNVHAAYEERGVTRVIERRINAMDTNGLFRLAWPDSMAWIHEVLMITHVDRTAYIPCIDPPLPIITDGDNKAATLSKIDAKIEELRKGNDKYALQHMEMIRESVSEVAIGVINTFDAGKVPPFVEPSEPMRAQFERWVNVALVALCDGDRRHVEIVLFFMRCCIMYPGLKLHWALILIGPQRVGKSMVRQLLEACIGRHNTNTIMGARIGGKFNSFMSDCQLLAIEELFVPAKDYQTENDIKTVITDPMISVERKGQDIVVERNHANLIATSNKAAPIRIVPGDARYMIVGSVRNTTQDIYRALNLLDEEGNVDNARHAEFYGSIQDMISTSQNVGMLKSLIRDFPFSETFSMRSLPVFSDAACEAVEMSYNKYHAAIIELIESGFNHHINEDYVYVPALRNAFIVPTSPVADVAYHAQSIAKTLKLDMGYGFKARLSGSGNGVNLGIIYAKSQDVISACKRAASTSGSEAAFLSMKVATPSR